MGVQADTDILLPDSSQIANRPNRTPKMHFFGFNEMLNSKHF